MTDGVPAWMNWPGWIWLNVAFSLGWGFWLGWSAHHTRERLRRFIGEK